MADNKFDQDDDDFGPVEPDRFYGASPRNKYSDIFRQSVFNVWYEAGKPGATQLIKLLPSTVDPVTKSTLKMVTLQMWIDTAFTTRAIVLDTRVVDEIETTLVADKVEMLQRHADIGREMQKLALDYFADNKVNSPKVAVALLVQGVRMEREAKSLPKIFAEISKKSDAELLDDLRNMASQGKIIDLDDSDMVSSSGEVYGELPSGS